MNMRSFLIVVYLVITLHFLSVKSPVAAQNTASLKLIQIIDTSIWNPSSPDPAGIVYWPAIGAFVVADSEVNEMPVYFQGSNLFQMSSAGGMVKTFSTLLFSHEPTDIAVDPDGSRIFISDDNLKRVFEISFGTDAIFGTEDDSVSYFSTSIFGSEDPEGIAYANSTLYISDGLGNEIYQITPGPNGVFDGGSPGSDDTITHFDTSVFGIQDPEGVTYDSVSNSLFIVDNYQAQNLAEVTLEGNLIKLFDISFLNGKALAGIAIGPQSTDPSGRSIYIADRGVDNNTDPTENDGKIYEISLPCEMHSTGDADCDGNITVADYEIWRKEYTGLSSATTADFSINGSVNLDDYEIWRKGYIV